MKAVLDHIRELTLERDELLRARDVAIDLVHDLQARLDANVERAEKVEASLAAALDVIRYYADESNCQRICVYLGINGSVYTTHIDDGQRARAFLAAQEKP